MNAGKQNPNNRHIGLHITFHAYLLLLVLGLLTIGCDKADEELTQPVQEKPQQILYDFSTKHREGGIARWTLVADKAEFLKEITYLQNPTVQIFQDGKLAITITGDHGELIESSNDIHVLKMLLEKAKMGTCTPMNFTGKIVMASCMHRMQPRSCGVIQQWSVERWKAIRHLK